MIRDLFKLYVPPAESTFSDLPKALARVTPEHLGPDADDLDVEAFREALSRSWPNGPTVPLSSFELGILETAILEGRIGHDDEGRDWVQVAFARRLS